MPPTESHPEIHDADTWHSGLRALDAFRQRSGHTDVPVRARAGGVELGRWVHSVRFAYAEGTLSVRRAETLAALPGWTWQGPRPGSWRATFDTVRIRIAEHGSLDTALRDDADAAMTDWVEEQRRAHATGELHPVRYANLDGLRGWSWTSEKPEPDGPLDSDNRSRWDVGLSALRRFSAERGLVDIPLGTRVDGVDLVSWVGRCREEHGAGTLTDDQVAALESLPGWTWGGAWHAWTRGMDALLEFVAEHGHASPLQRTLVGDVALGSWVNRRRREYHTGALTNDKIAQLEGLPGWEWTSTRHDAWRRGMETLSSFIAEYGHADPGRTQLHNGIGLGNWVYAQRRKHRDGTLPDDRVAALEALPGWRWFREP